MKKAADAFRSIGEVSQLVGVAPHVLRYWEAQFPLFSPVKRRDGRRYYRPDDIRMAAGLCETLREEGTPIKLVKKQMAQDRGAALKARGAARLGGSFASEVAGSSAGQPVGPAKVEKTTARRAKSSKATGKNPARAQEKTAPEKGPDMAESAPRQQRKAGSMSDSLPLFPELESGKARKEPSKTRATAESPLRGDTAPGEWLGRLNAVASGLRGTRSLPPDAARALRDRLDEARRGLAA
ncbi:MerR family transcriptional regulator [Paracoccus sediminicola]|uniref:MerR family transcriptional regulator n=1 Tax=Paracoccus sediminicola TaxID=3017783 RepID=UPI0022F0D9E6|nr:MerR family transcriptional regulator [Paracoccus sediminicola]WBU57438.1 MerR family transcriptional regulator [Paracoccus sediminicola]